MEIDLEKYIVLGTTVLVLLIIVIIPFVVPTADSYTLICDGVEYQCVDFDVKSDRIELFDHLHPCLTCGEKCSRRYIAKAENTFEVIPHKSSIFERIFKK